MKFFVRKFWYIGLSLVSLWVYWPLLRSEPILARDDMQILSSLPSQFTAKAWREAWTSPQNPDLQPVRDLSLWVDKKLGQKIGHRVFHASNLLLFWGVLCALYLLLDLLSPDFWFKALLVGLVAFHPVALMTVAWIAGRKYILAALFLLLATRSYLKFLTSGRGVFATLVHFVAALLSQPAATPWPFWASLFAEKKYRFRSLGSLLLLAFALTFIWAVGQKLHYQNYFSAQSLLERNVQLSGWRSPFEFALAWGRATWQLFVPLHLAVTYSADSLVNRFGLALFAFLIFLLLRCKRIAQISFRWLLWGVLPLAMTLAKVQNLFLSDTYIFLLLLSLALAAGATSNLLLSTQRQRHFVLIGGVFLLLGFVVQSELQVTQWLDDRALWRQAFVEEPDCFDSLVLANQAFRSGEYVEAIAVSKFHLRGCRDSLNPGLLALTIFFDPNLSEVERRKLLVGLPERQPLIKVLSLAMLLNQRDFEDLQQYWQQSPLSREELRSVLPYQSQPLEKAVRESCGSGSPEKPALCAKLTYIIEGERLEDPIQAFWASWDQ